MNDQTGMTDHEAYLAVADELSDPETTLDDLDEGCTAQARAYAKRSHKRWPPRPTNDGWNVQIFSS